MPAEEWTQPEHVGRYLARADEFPHRLEDGRLIARLLERRPRMRAVGLDFSAVMLDAARERFAGEEGVELIKHDLGEPLPDLGRFVEHVAWKWLEMALLVGVKPTG